MNQPVLAESCRVTLGCQSSENTSPGPNELSAEESGTDDVQRRFYWKGMVGDVTLYMKVCDPCQNENLEGVKQHCIQFL